MGSKLTQMGKILLNKQDKSNGETRYISYEKL